MTCHDIKKIAEESGIEHARFCVEQEASQRGRDKCRDLFRQLDLIENEEWMEHIASLSEIRP